MASISFPSSPSNGDTYTFNGVTYEYNSAKSQWIIQTGTSLADVNINAIGGSMVPSANVTYDLGTADNRWRDLYLSGSSLNLGSAQLTADGNALVLPEGSSVGNITIGAGGATVYANTSSLPKTSLTAGNFAFVGNTLFITNGTGWYSVGVTNQTPSLSISVSDISLGATGNTINFTFTASDPDGPTPTVTAELVGANTSQANVTVYSSNSTVTVENLSATDYSANIVLTATDGIDQTFGTVTLSVVYLSELWDETVLSIGTNSGMNYALTGTQSTGVTQSLTASDISFANDGSVLIAKISNTQVASYSLSTPYDITSIGSGQTYTVSEETSLDDVVLGDSGTKMYVVGISTDTVYQYALSTPYNVSTATYSSKSVAVNGQESAPRGLAFSTDGTKMFITGNSGDDVNSYTLGTAWDVSTATFDNVTFSVSSQMSTPLTMRFSNDGKNLYIGDSGGTNTVFRYYLTTAWDISTASLTDSFAHALDPAYGIAISDDGTKLILASNSTLYEHTMGTSLDNSTFIDRSTNAHTVTPTGTPTQTAFHPYLDNWSVEFSTDRVDMSSVLVGSTISTFTVECWVNLSSLPTVSTSTPIQPQGTVTLDGLPGAATNYHTFGVNTDGTVGLRWFDGAAKAVSSTTVLDLGKWYHIACVVDSNSIQLYVNGVAESMSGTTTLTNRNGSTGQSGFGSNYWTTFNGYISNLRVTHSAVYASAFTPPTENLTDISGTQLLTCQSNRFIDRSTSNRALTIVNDPVVSAFNPFGQESEYAVGENKGSYYSAKNSYLTIDGSSIDFTQAWTIELWVYYNTSLVGAEIVSAINSGGGVDGIYILNASDVYLTINGSGWTIAQALDTYLNQYSWHHISLTWDTTTYNVWVDGISRATLVNSTPVSFSSQAIGIGATSTGSGQFGGYISDYNITTGTAKYTSTFTPPTAPVGNTNADLYLPMDNAGIFDKTGLNTLTAVGNAATSTTQTKFADTAMYFDGSGDYIDLESPLLTSNVFTVECWCYTSTVGTSGSPFYAQGETGGSTRFWFGLVNGSTGVSRSSGPIAQLGDTELNVLDTSFYDSWAHFAVTSDGSTLRLFVNGQLVDSASSSSTPQQTHGVIGSLGADWSTSYVVNGYIENLQILKGVAKYTTNFTPPNRTQGRIYQAES